MRVLVGLLVLVFPFAAGAESRFGIHVGGGVEAGMVRSAHPAGVVEAGLTAEHLWSGKRWGIAAGFERIARGDDDVSDEWKLDAGIGFTNAKRSAHAIVGVGVRTLTVPGGENRLPSTIHGVDLIRLDNRVQIVRRGAISLDFYVGWTLGIYRGRQYDDRIGDMVQTSRVVTSVTSVCMLGLQTSFALD